MKVKPNNSHCISSCHNTFMALKYIVFFIKEKVAKYCTLLGCDAHPSVQLGFTTKPVNKGMKSCPEHMWQYVLIQW